MALTPTSQVLTPDVKNALAAGLPSFRSADRSMQNALLDATHGFQVFTMGVPDVLPNGAGLKGATLSGWRIAVQMKGVAMAGDIYTMPRGGNQPTDRPRLACVRQGDQIEALLRTFAALTQAPLSSQLPTEPFNVHVLIMPGLFTDALWLEPQNPGSSQSYLVPYHTRVDGVHLERAYTENELIALLQPLAIKWKSYKRRPYVARRAAGR